MRLQDGEVVSLTVRHSYSWNAIGIVESRNNDQDNFTLDSRPGINWHREKHIDSQGYYRSERLI